MKVLLTEQQFSNIIKNYTDELQQLPNDVDIDKVAPNLAKFGSSLKGFADEFSPTNIIKNKVKDTLGLSDNDDEMMHPLGKKYTISSGFGQRTAPTDERTGKSGTTNHQGVDIPVPIGTKVYAPANGTIVAAYDTSSTNRCGKLIEIDTGKYLLKFCHLSDWKIRKGDVVKKGQVIGLTGDSGVATGPHLHYAISSKSGIAYNPVQIQPNLA